MNTLFTAVTSDEDIECLVALADEIWHEYWPALIGDAQTDYMVERFQSTKAITRDMCDHAYEYWFMHHVDDGRVIGYTGGHIERETNRFFISKIYLRSPERGHGFASDTIRFYEDLCQKRNLTALYLTVYKKNDPAIRAYLSKGFVIIDAVETSIGGGFIMDDYIMQKQIVPRR